jgi:hypothetical protein
MPPQLTVLKKNPAAQVYPAPPRVGVRGLVREQPDSPAIFRHVLAMPEVFINKHHQNKLKRD